MWSSRDKGKGRASPLAFRVPGPRRTLRTRDAEGSGGPDGVILPLQYVSDGPYDISYTLPVLVGSDSEPQNLSLQVDTGSSDLWIASSSCSSSACDSAPRYDPQPDSAIPTGDNFAIQYLVGNVSGPIYWDTITVGGYNVDNQALAAADVVEDEPLESQFSGVLGLALPSNSIIAQQILPGVGDAPDGAVWTSNLFGITPLEVAPSARFLSIALERPGSAAVPSILGIGRHPAALVPDPSLISYSTLYEPSSIGPMFWKASVRGVTVYTNSSRMPIPLGRGASGVFPSAVLDTGVPVILTTKAVADAIYGAIGVDPAADSMYYVPCTTPLNLTVTLDDRNEIPLHPLDMTTPPPSTSDHPDSCIGLIQASADATLSNPSSDIGDMVFGVAFLRNVYTVLAYDVPFANGSFPAPLVNETTTVRPRLGLLGLTNPTVAMDEFHRVRVLNQPLGDTNGGAGGTTGSSGPHKQSVGIDVLIGLASFVGLCLLLFGLRWLFVRRSLQRRRAEEGNLSARDAKSRDLALALGGYQLARRGAHADDGLPTEDELRQRRYEAYKHSLHTVSTDRTQIEPSGDDGYIKEPQVAQVVDMPPQEQARDHSPLLPLSPLLPVSPRDHSPLLQEHSPERERHSRVLSVNLPLIPAAEDEELNPTSMAGIGTARHSAAFNSRGRSTSNSQQRRSATSPSRSPDS